MTPEIENLQKTTAITILNKMLSSRHFSICELDTAARLLDVPSKRGKSYKVLRSLHCVDYDDMPDELVTMLPGLVMDSLSQQAPQVFAVDESHKSGRVLKLVHSATT